MNKEFELTLWRKYSQKGVLKEEKIETLSSNTMSYVGRAQNIVLTEKFDENNQLTFELPINYFNLLTSSFERNYFVDKVLNESRIKLKIKKKWYNNFTSTWEDYKWYEFIVKNKVEKRNKKSLIYSYTCKNAYLEELGATGYDIELTEENGLGTAHDLARYVLNNSDWSYIQTEVFPEYKSVYDINTGTEKLIPIKTDQLKLIHDYNGQSLYANCYSYLPSQYKKDGSVNPHWNNGDFYNWEDGLGNNLNYIYGYNTYKIITSYCDQSLINPSENFTSTAGWSISDSINGSLDFNYTTEDNLISYLEIINNGNNKLLLSNNYSGTLEVNKYYIIRVKYDSESLIDFSIYNKTPSNNIAPILIIPEIISYDDISGYHSYWFKVTEEIINPYFTLEIPKESNINLRSMVVFPMIGYNEDINEELFNCLDNQEKYFGELTSLDLILEENSNLIYIQGNYYINEQQEITPIYLLPGEIVQNNYNQSFVDYFTETYSNGKYILEHLDTVGTLVKLSGYDYDKRKLVTAEKSNRFNILEDIAEKFQIFIKILVEHNDDGSIKTYSIANKNIGYPIKKITFCSKLGMNQYHGFTYGVNLNDVQRTIDSNELVTKMFVESKDSSITEDGLITILNSNYNDLGENFLYNFDYYLNQGLLNSEYFFKDYIPFVKNVKRYNNLISLNSSTAMSLKSSIANLTSPEYVARMAQAALITATKSLISPFWTDMNNLLINSGQEPFSSNLEYLDINRESIESNAYNIEIYNSQANQYKIISNITTEALPIIGETVLQTDGVNIYSGHVENLQRYISSNPISVVVNDINPSYHYYFSININDELLYYHFTIEETISGLIELHKESSKMYIQYVEGLETLRKNINFSVNGSPLDNYTDITSSLNLINEQLIIVYSTEFDLTNNSLIKYNSTCSLSDSLNLVLGNEEATENNYYEALTTYYNTYQMYKTQINEYDRQLYGEINPIIQFTKKDSNNSCYYFSFITKNKLNLFDGYQIKINETFYNIVVNEGNYYLSYITDPSLSLLTNYSITQYKDLTLATYDATVYGDEDNYSLTDTESLYNQYLQVINHTNSLYTLKSNSIINFEKKYSTFIKEGCFTGTENIDYTSNDEYCLDALRVLNTSCMPKVSYVINSIDLSRFVHPYLGAEWGKDFEYNVGDTSYVSDPELFGYNQKTNAPLEQEVMISEIQSYIDQDKEDKITIKNYDTRFEELFSRIAASIISLNLNQDIYSRANSISAAGTIDQTVLQNSFENNSNLAFVGLNGGYKLSQEEGLILGVNSINQMRLNDKGLFLTNDGGNTWVLGLSSEGMNANTVNTGSIDTAKISITNNNQKNYIMDKRGLTAYKTNSSNQFIRFDKYGLYFTKLGDSFSDGWDSNYNINEASNRIQNLSNVSITWDGFCYNGAPGNSGNKILIGDTKQLSREGVNCIIYTTDGSVTTFSLDEAGNLYARGKITATEGYIGTEENGFEINSNSLFNRSKNSLTNINSGLYMGQDGFNIGDENTYIKANFEEGTIKISGLEDEGDVSDIKLKYDIQECPEKYGKIIDSLTPVIYKLKNGTSGRYHSGLISNVVKEELEKLDIPMDEYGLLCETGVENPILKIRYKELIALNILKEQSLQKQIDKQQEIINNLIEEINYLKGKI